MSQATLSGYEKKDKIEQEVLEKIAKALDIPVEAITELEQATSINIYSGTWRDNAITNQYTFNPIDKIVELYDEKIALYERMLKEKDEAISLLHVLEYQDSYAELNLLSLLGQIKVNISLKKYYLCPKK